MYQVARNLQDCLAFASFKAQNGWQDRTLRSIEPEITEKLMRRKRPFVDHEMPSDSSVHSMETNEPHNGSRKRVRASSTSGTNRLSNFSSWKQDHQLPQSSPVDHNTFESTFPTLHDSPMFDAPVISDDDDQDLPMHSMQEHSSSVISSSPPRTPPPTRRMQNSSKQAGADLLLYLANSPRSPAVHVTQIPSAQKDIPSTPPSRHAHLPSAMMHTPGTNLGLFNGALQTPGQNFNFADFCNVTPSPGQAQWGGRTPGLSKTPARLARRGLNFDAIVPPSTGSQRKALAAQGLALQLGDELIPR
jgi:hypothetical protein